jgi:hypothetical protein
VVDAFLQRLDASLATLSRKRERGFFPLEQDFYTFAARSGIAVRSFGFRFGPVKWRVFWARIGNGLYVASKPYILDDLHDLEAARAQTTGKPPPGDQGPVAHGMIRIRPEHWQRVLTDFRLGWAENDREACINNLGALSSVARAVTARNPGQAAGAEQATRQGDEVLKLADHLHDVHFFCPEGGHYTASADGKTVACDIHGSAGAPRQPIAPQENSTPESLLREFAGLTVSLTFLEDGLHAVVKVSKK